MEMGELLSQFEVCLPILESEPSYSFSQFEVCLPILESEPSYSFS